MSEGFRSFVILADMRTGSNALEERLEALGRVDQAGELFNPQFAGKPGSDALFGVTLAERDRDPAAMLAAHRAGARALPGFRLFSDHDPRALALVLDDPACAKVVLTRDPLDSFLSLEIARATGQWWLGDFMHRKAAKVRFDAAAFAAYRAARDGHLARIRNRLQVTGQTAFWVSYDEIGDDAVLFGLLRFIGAPLNDELPAGKRGRRQNPVAPAERVENPQEMARALAELAASDLDEAPDVTTRPGVGARRWLASDAAGLMYLPVPGTPSEAVAGWLADNGQIETGFTQRTLRQWKRSHPGHRSFTVVRHPIDRAHDAFVSGVLRAAGGPHAARRATLRRSYGVDVPEDPADPGFGPAEHRAAFLAFLAFLRGCLSEQTAIRPDPAWLPQSLHLEAMAAVSLPDAILREDSFQADAPAALGQIRAVCLGRKDPVLGKIHDAALERAARRAYARDYMMFGFGPWSDQAA